MDKGQYFTTSLILQDKVSEFILNSPDEVLEPSVGRGDLVNAVNKKHKNINFDCYEIDEKLDFVIPKNDIIFGDFLKQKNTKKYKTIIGNPPYVRTKTGNLYISFIDKCIDLLKDGGELIFIIPSDFFKLTCAGKLLCRMLSSGNFTHIFHPENEKLFTGASINVLIFRYVKTKYLSNTVIYNNENRFVTNSKGMINFSSENTGKTNLVEDFYNVYVGMVSGKESVFRNEKLGNIELIYGDNKRYKYIFIDDLESNVAVKNFLLENKNILLNRKIKKFNEGNWFEWGAPRNKGVIEKNMGKKCIYIKNITRDSVVAFKGRVEYFGGGLLMLLSKTEERNILKDIEYFNSDTFKKNFIYSGRFKTGQRQVSNSCL